MKKYLFSLQVLIAVFIATSCTEKIDLKLRDAENKIVIEGNITDQTGPYTITLSKTRFYNQNNNFETVSGAQIVINDDAGNTDTLVEAAPGIYNTHVSFLGQPGRTYQLLVNAESKTYTSTCYMPFPVTIDSITFEKLILFGDTFDRVFAVILDPAGINNYYKGSTVNKGIRANRIRIQDDLFNNGKLADIRLGTDAFLPGDTLTAELMSIDKTMYEYFNSLETNTTDGQSAAPANPTSNITNGAIGYFNAFSVSKKDVIAP